MRTESVSRRGRPGALPLDPTRALPWTCKGTVVPLTPLPRDRFGEEGGLRYSWKPHLSPPSSPNHLSNGIKGASAPLRVQGGALPGPGQRPGLPLRDTDPTRRR
jgi:hypothetical protein